MHIPDGFLSVPVIAATSAIGGATVAFSGIRLQLEKRAGGKALQTASVGALLFSAQMLNFPILGGTSGHLVGGVMAAVLLGPVAAVVVITAILVTQCLLFADGGITALGANVLNMGLIGTLGGYGIYRGLVDLIPGKVGKELALAIAAWASVVLAALACGVELVLSGMAPMGLALPAMLGAHAQIGVGEALITVVGVWALRPRGVEVPALALGQRGVSLKVASVVAILLAVVSPLACGLPDGLDHTAERLGFAELGFVKLGAPMGEYVFPGIGTPAAATVLAGLAGTIVVFLIVAAATRGMRRRAN